MSIFRVPAVKAGAGRCSHASIYTAITAKLSTKRVPTGQRFMGGPGYISSRNPAKNIALQVAAGGYKAGRDNILKSLLTMADKAR